MTTRSGDLSSVPIYGNYRDYYFKRPLASDARLSLLSVHSPMMFTEKRVLDVGCNEGWITCEIGAYPIAPLIGDLRCEHVQLRHLAQAKLSGSTSTPPLLSGHGTVGGPVSLGNSLLPLKGLSLHKTSLTPAVR
jgi:hypothetical protein